MSSCLLHPSATAVDILQTVRVFSQSGLRLSLVLPLPSYTSHFSAVILVLQGGDAGIENACPQKLCCPIQFTINSFDFLQSVGLSLPNGNSSGLGCRGRHLEFEAV